MPEISGFVRQVLDAQTGTSPPPEDNDLAICALAFSGKRLSEIRDAMPRIRVYTILEAIRRVRDAIRRNEVPEKILEQFPDIVKEQLERDKLGGARPSTALALKIKSITRALKKPTSAKFKEYIEDARAKFGAVGVPATVTAILQAVEAGDRDMIKLSAEVFHLKPVAGRAPLFQQLIDARGQAKDPQAKRQTPYYEERLRQAHKRIAAKSQEEDATDAEEVQTETLPL